MNDQKIMNYEINFLILQSQTENADKLRKGVKELITKYTGKITDELIYQKRKLAYEINHEQYGFYTVYRFDLENGETLKDLTKDLNLLKGVTRHIIVRSDELPKLQKEVGKDTMAEQEKQNAARKAEAPTKTGKKVLAEIGKETEKQTIKAPVVEPTETKEKTSVETKSEDKEISIKEAEKTEPKAVDDIPEKKPSKKDESKEGEEEISMEDLDKKLDEILDI
jgi:small subunit ribosomal protein S6